MVDKKDKEKTSNDSQVAEVSEKPKKITKKSRSAIVSAGAKGDTPQSSDVVKKEQQPLEEEVNITDDSSEISEERYSDITKTATKTKASTKTKTAKQPKEVNSSEDSPVIEGNASLKTSTKPKTVKSPRAEDVKKSIKDSSVKYNDVPKASTKTKASSDNKIAVKKNQEKSSITPGESTAKEKTSVASKGGKNKITKNTNPKFVAVGRRKTAVARVFMQKGTGVILINNKELQVFSPNDFLNYKILQPLELVKVTDDFDISVNVSGGGPSAQVEAIRLGIARCLLKFDLNYRAALKNMGYLTRDPRMVERKKFGHKKARRSFQFSKR